MVEAFPCYWPEGQPRVPDFRRRSSQYAPARVCDNTPVYLTGKPSCFT